MIRDNFARIQNQIAAVCKRLGRNPNEIILIGVTKFADVSKIQEAIDVGLRDIGENKVQEGQNKFPALKISDFKVTKHLIGHLQTNKVKQALEFFDLIHSVDSLKLAREIEKQAAKSGKNTDILIQVSTSGEEQKFGIAPSEVFSLIDEVGKLAHIRVLGLMTMAQLTEDKTIIRNCFKDLRILRDQIRQRFAGNHNVAMKYLSMGMSGDYEIALEEGSNMVRIGSAIFNQ